MMAKVPWFLPVAEGKQYVLPDRGEYGFFRCIEPTHVFEQRPGYCRCGQHFWPAPGTVTSRTIQPGETL